MCAFCFLLASRLQNESARVFLPVLFSSFPSQCVLSLSPFFWMTSYLFCFQVGSIYKLSVLNLSSSLGAGRILWSDVALPSQFPAALLLDSPSFVLGQLFHTLLLVASGCSERNSFLCVAPEVCNEKK